MSSDEAYVLLEDGARFDGDACGADAHATGELDDVRWGVDQARRAWVEARDVLNARPRDALLAWVAGKPARVAA